MKLERETPVEEEIDRGKAALTELFEQANNGETPIMVKRVVDDIDEIVRAVRFDGWQNTHAGEREVKIPLVPKQTPKQAPAKEEGKEEAVNDEPVGAWDALARLYSGGAVEIVPVCTTSGPPRSAPPAAAA